MNRLNTIIFLLLFFKNLTAQSHLKGKNPGSTDVDSISYDQLCEPKIAPQYYQVNGRNLKSSYQILKEWLSFYKKIDNWQQSGFLTARFIVTCKGEPISISFFEMDENYQPIEFKKELKAQIADFIRQLGAWKLVNYEDKPVNYYYYFIFNIKNGEFKSIAP